MRPAPGMIENAILNTWSATFLTIRNFKLPRFPFMTGTAAGADPSGGCAGAILIRTGAPMGGQLRGCQTDQDAQRLPASGDSCARILKG